MPCIHLISDLRKSVLAARAVAETARTNALRDAERVLGELHDAQAPRWDWNMKLKLNLIVPLELN